MGNTVKENSTGTFFTNVPDHWSARKDVPLAKKVIVAYIYTRANIENMDWELVATDIVNLWGIGKSTVSRVIRDLAKQGVIQYTETRKIKNNEWASKIFKIDRQALHNLMNPKPDAVPLRNRTSSIVEPHQFRGGTAPVPSGNLEEELKEENNKKSTKEEGKTEFPLFIKPVNRSTPIKRITDEQFDDIFGAVLKKTNKETSASAAIPSNNPTATPQTTDTKKEMNDSSARPADAARNNLPIPSARPMKCGEAPKAVPKRSAVEKFLSKTPKEQNEWLDDVEANKTLVRNLRNGKDVRWTKAFEDYFANC